MLLDRDDQYKELIKGEMRNIQSSQNIQAPHKQQ